VWFLWGKDSRGSGIGQKKFWRPVCHPELAKDLIPAEQLVVIVNGANVIRSFAALRMTDARFKNPTFAGWNPLLPLRSTILNSTNNS